MSVELDVKCRSREQDGIVKVTRLPRYTLGTVREEKASYRRCSSMIKNLASGFLDELQLAS